MPNYKIGIDLAADDNASGDLKKVSGAADSLDDAMSKGSASTGGLGASLGGLISPAGLALGAVTAIGGAMIATGAQAMDLANQVETSAALMTTQLALTDEQSAAFEGTMRDIYENNYGESFEDIAASLTTVEQGFARIGGIAPESLQEVTEQALAMRDAFGTEVQETIGATATLMENFGLTSTQAMDFLVAGNQKGLNSSGDFLETIGEYSVQFSQGGASAAEFFSILETGNQGGVLGTDKVADAFKEFGIRIVDDSKTTKDALAGIGISYDTLKAGFTDGSVTTVAAMQTVIDKIMEIEDPVARNTAGVALFGTQWEDITETVIGEIDTQKTALEDLGGAADSLGDQYDTAGNKISEATRKWESALVDVGQELNGLTEFALPGLAAMVDFVIVPALKVFTMWLNDVRDLVGTIGGFLDMIGLIPDLPVSPATSSGSLPVQTPSQAQGSSVGGSQIYQQFYIERGDFETVQEAAQVGIGQAQRTRGS